MTDISFPRARPLLLLLATLTAFLLLAVGAQARTTINRWSPFDEDGSLRSGLRAAPAYGGECFTNSFIVRDAYRCIRGNRLEDPCFVDPIRDDVVLCVSSPFARVATRLRFDGDLPSDGNASAQNVWAIRLATGQRCTLLGGATSADSAGRRLNFICSGRRTALWGNPNRSTSTWRIRMSHSFDPTGPKRLVAIREAFIGVG